MRNEELGLEVVAVTHREQLETVGNVERFALSWATGFWHEAPERDVSKHDRHKPPAVRYYRSTELPTGTKLSSEVTESGVAVSFAARIRGSVSTVNEQHLVLPPNRGSWQLLSVHAAGQRTYNLTAESKIVIVWCKCVECETHRSFPIAVWRNEALTLGCGRCRDRVKEPKVDNKPKWNESNLPEMHGVYKLHRVDKCETSANRPPRLVVWGKCTGGKCDGHTSSFNTSQWATMDRRMSCPTCMPGRHKAIDSAMRSRIHALLLGGATIGTTARLTGVHKSTVDRVRTQMRHEKQLAAHEAFNASVAQ